MNKRDLVAEIIARRARNDVYYAALGLSVRLSQLQASFDRRSTMPAEMLRYFPIALVACVEGYFRLSIQTLINAGTRFSSNIGDLNVPTLKFDLTLVKSIEGKFVSLGELVAHALPIKRLDDIAHHVTVLIGNDFLKALRSVVCRADVELEKRAPVPMIGDADKVYASVVRVFELRHIFAHELAPKLTPSLSEVEKLFDDTVLFLKTSDEYFSEVLHPNRPLSQMDMNVKAHAEFQAADSKRKGVLSQVGALLLEKDKPRLSVAVSAWERFRDEYASFDANVWAEGGSLFPLLYATNAQAITEEFAKLLTSLLRSLETQSTH